jgi:cytochrome c oxidase assembly protein subunit 16
MVFSSRSFKQTNFSKTIKKHPSVFGVPFLLLMVGASYGLSQVTQTRYDLHDQKVKVVRCLSYWCNWSR